MSVAERLAGSIPDRWSSSLLPFMQLAGCIWSQGRDTTKIKECYYWLVSFDQITELQKKVILLPRYFSGWGGGGGVGMQTQNQRKTGEIGVGVRILAP